MDNKRANKPLKTRLHTVTKLKYKRMFKRIGQLSGEYKIKLRENAVPAIHPRIEVPVAIKR